MLFNSLQFAVFFTVVYGLYLILSHRWQNLLLLIASYVFYSSWNWKFLSLIIISTVLDYVCGLKIHESPNPRRRKLFLVISIVGNLGILGFFKYYNFFAENLAELLAGFGLSLSPLFIHVILPVGISFYTFQTMSYSIDIYRREMEPTRQFLDFALFVSFFPQLVAGPIERAKHLLPQMLSPRVVTREKFYGGCYLLLWGLFQKVFIADNLAKIVDPIFAAPGPYNGLAVLMGLYAFAFQIFCDFAGYSNMARGLGRCMGFDIMVNFNIPYFALNPRDFWHRWHISLSRWLRDYLYIPLGGNRRGTLFTYRNLAITMLLGGLWHGAAWTFILWGAYQGVLLIGYHLIAPFLQRVGDPSFPPWRGFWVALRIIIFFQLICLGWLFFRAQSLHQLGAMLRGLFNPASYDSYIGVGLDSLRFAVYLPLLLLLQIFQYRSNNLEIVRRFPVPVRVVVYIILVYSIVLLGVNKPEYFIYFQF